MLLSEHTTQEPPLLKFSPLEQFVNAAQEESPTYLPPKVEQQFNLSISLVIKFPSKKRKEDSTQILIVVIS